MTVATLAICVFITGCEKDTTPASSSKRAIPKTDDGSDADDSAIAGTTPNETTPNESSSEISSPGFPDTYTETIPETLVEFEMVLVPGNPETGMKPFYMGKNEVTWDEFDYWALCSDIKDKKALLEREKMLRPSAPHDLQAIYRNWGREGQPVVGVSRLSAERYCDWLSEQTGKKYRLPTSAQWDYAFTTGGGVLDQAIEPDALGKSAWFVGNTLDTETTFANKAMAVGKLEPNELGIHDMLGNVAEWVLETGEEKVARGGHYMTSAADLTGNHRDVEDHSIWNENFPQGKISLWWYFDADFVGLRLVCDPE